MKAPKPASGIEALQDTDTARRLRADLDALRETTATLRRTLVAVGIVAAALLAGNVVWAIVVSRM